MDFFRQVCFLFLATIHGSALIVARFPCFAAGEARERDTVPVVRRNQNSRCQCPAPEDAKGERSMISPPLRLSWWSVQGALAIAPVSFDPEPSAVPVYPMPRHPYRMRTWRSRPVAVNPNVTYPVPALVPLNPHIVPSRRRRTPFHHARRWSNAHKHLPVGHARTQHRGGHGRHQKSLHIRFYLLSCRQSTCSHRTQNDRQQQSRTAV
jgi:hypothetical protein